MKKNMRPDYYGGKDDPYEVVKVIRAWGLNFQTGNALKYIARAGKKDKSKHLEDLQKAITYLQIEASNIEQEQAKQEGQEIAQKELLPVTDDPSPPYQQNVLVEAVAAFGLNRELGYKGELPWGSDYPQDLARYKELIQGKVLVVGKTTAESYARFSLKLAEHYIIVSRETSPQQALKQAKFVAADRGTSVMIIGGAYVYESLMDEVDTFYLTYIKGHFRADCFFPESAYKKLAQVSREIEHHKDNHGIKFVKYKMKEPCISTKKC